MRFVVFGATGAKKLLAPVVISDSAGKIVNKKVNL